MITIEELEAQATAAEADKIELSAEDKRAAAAHARIARAREEKAAAEKVKRGNVLAAQEMAARAAAPPGVLVKGIDLVDLFPLGEAPPVDMMPGAGVLVVRDPIQGLGGFHREVEHKKRDVHEIYADLLCHPGNVLYPEAVKDTAEGMRLRAFCERYHGAAIGAGDVVAKLGGSKAQADKRGRS